MLNLRTFFFGNDYFGKFYFLNDYLLGHDSKKEMMTLQSLNGVGGGFCVEGPRKLRWDPTHLSQTSYFKKSNVESTPSNGRPLAGFPKRLLLS